MQLVLAACALLLVTQESHAAHSIGEGIEALFYLAGFTLFYLVVLIFGVWKFPSYIKQGGKKELVGVIGTLFLIITTFLVFWFFPLREFLLPSGFKPVYLLGVYTAFSLFVVKITIAFAKKSILREYLGIIFIFLVASAGVYWGWLYVKYHLPKPLYVHCGNMYDEIEGRGYQSGQYKNCDRLTLIVKKPGRFEDKAYYEDLVATHRINGSFPGQSLIRYDLKKRKAEK